MFVLALGLLVFLGTHSLTMQRDLRMRLRMQYGEGTYKLAYTAASLLGLVLIIWGFGLYRQGGWVDVWYPPTFMRHLAATLMLPVFVLLFATYLPGRIKQVTKHPTLLAVKVWATGHLLANGDLGSMVIFATFLAWAVVARISMRTRVDGQMGSQSAGAKVSNDVIAVVLGIGVWALFAFWLHRVLIGVPIFG